MKEFKNKKGFTIVELVVVIAVIGVLTAVLVPTFTTLVRQANLANDQSMVKNMNTTLAMETSEKGKFAHAGDSIVALNANGFEGKYSPYSTGFHYGYSYENNTMYLINEKNEIAYPKSDVALSNLWILWSNRAVDKVEGATKYISLTNITGNGGYYETHFGGTSEYTVDLAGHFINSETTLTNVKVVNGVLIAGAQAEEESGVISMEAGNDNDITAGSSTSNRTVIENKVFDGHDTYLDGTTQKDIELKVENTTNVTYKNCYFYNWKGSAAGIMKSNTTFESCTFINAESYVFSVQGDSSTAYEGTLTVKDCTFINCARVFNMPVFVYGEDNPGSIVITGNTFNAVTGQDRGVFQLNRQTYDHTKSYDLKGYINITISDNNFTEIATTSAGLFILHESLCGEAGVSADHIIFSDNTVSASIPSDKYVVNDDGKADSAFNPYNIGEFKTALKNKFIYGRK